MFDIPKDVQPNPMVCNATMLINDQHGKCSIGKVGGGRMISTIAIAGKRPPSPPAGALFLGFQRCPRPLRSDHASEPLGTASREPPKPIGYGIIRFTARQARALPGQPMSMS
jgi:hypothetical protein